MAQTKTKGGAKRSQGSKKSQAGSRGSANKTGSRGSSAAKSRAKSTKSKSTRKSNGSAPVGSAKEALESTSQGAGSTVGRIASGAKIPLVAAGAAIAGAAGGAAWGSRQAGSRGLRGAIARRPMVKIKSSDIAKAATEVGNLASRVQVAREANGSKNGSKHRSPIEVVLDGLTARR